MELTKQNYFSKEADSHYMSVSQFKSFLSCEAKTMAKIKGEYVENKIEAFLLGSYVHAWNDGTLEEFKKENPFLFSTRGESKGQLLAKYEIGNKMIDVLSNDDAVTQFRNGEKEVVMTAELFGIPWKVMIDIYKPKEGAIVDLKTTKNIREKHWNQELGIKQNFIEFYDYLLQMAVYCEVEMKNRNEGEYLHPYIIAVSKEEIPDKEIIYLGQNFIQDKLAEIEQKLPRIISVKNGEVEPTRCEQCNYCKSTKKIKKIVHYSEL